MPLHMRNAVLTIAANVTCVLVLLGAGDARAMEPEPASLRLARVFGDAMVIQRDRPAPVWGWAKPGVSVTVGFAGQKHVATAAEDGRWEVRLTPLEASAEPRELTVFAGEQNVTVKDVLVGDVWLFSGDFGVWWEVFACENA